MLIKAIKFNARFSSNSFTWHVKTDQIEFQIRDIINPWKPEDNLKQNFQKITGEYVIFRMEKDRLLLIDWEDINFISLYKELYNPDQPRNLAKTVTVK